MAVSLSEVVSVPPGMMLLSEVGMRKAAVGKAQTASRTEAARRDPVKSAGIHYTPSELAVFLADRTLSQVSLSRPISVLDPACGDGSLLAAVVEIGRTRGLPEVNLYGLDRDRKALKRAELTLREIGHHDATLVQLDFLQSEQALPQKEIWPLAKTGDASLPTKFDVVIANPPYVRTQVLGKQQARRLARIFGLSGRVDLYHAFVGAMTSSLADDGVLGLLTSNRFLTTLAGASVRRLLWNHYELMELFDLGDTKLFSASVLPLILVARRRDNVAEQRCAFKRIYEGRGTSLESGETRTASSAIEALELNSARVRVGKVLLEVETGRLRPLGSPSDPWILSNRRLDSWLASVERHTDACFAELASIRVGVKTTADNVFIRDDWDRLPPQIRPEAQLLRPLLTHEMAAKWRASPGQARKSVLYPHVLSPDGRRRAVDLQDFPLTAAYLEHHREQLEGRDYVIQSGRAWYEIWVPQHPAEWAKPKIVFPDISDEPRFFYDETGAVVNGDCYWIPMDESLDRETVLLLLAVANSRFATRYYDAVCANRLYAGRRRFITQYVGRFPVPKRNGRTPQLVACVEQLLQANQGDLERSQVETEVNRLVDKSFGVFEETGR